MIVAKLKNDEKYPCPGGTDEPAWQLARGREVVILQIAGREKLSPEDDCGAEKVYLIKPMRDVAEFCNIPEDELGNLCVCEHLIEPGSVRNK